MGYIVAFIFGALCGSAATYACRGWFSKQAHSIDKLAGKIEPKG